MRLHDRDWIPYRILRGDIVSGEDFYQTNDSANPTYSETKLKLNLHNIIMGIIAGYHPSAAYDGTDATIVYHIQRP